MLRRLAMIAAAVFTAAPVFAFDMPARKPGLWEIKMDFVGRKLPAHVVKQCIDAASDKVMNSQFGGSVQEACSKQDMQKSSGSITIDSLCKFGDATTTSHAVVTGNFDSAYTVHITSTREGGRPLPGMAPSGATEMTVAAKWLGPCAADQKPGDMIMPNGVKVNVLEMPGTPKKP